MEECEGREEFLAEKEGGKIDTGVIRRKMGDRNE